MRDIATREGLGAVDGVALDLGVSSMQLDQPERGFSFMQDGPLDMRMGGEGPTAADLVNSLEESELADVIFVLGEERRARAIAKAIVARRTDQPIATTGELAELVTGVLGRKHDDKKHPATRTFQALRLYLNRELDELAGGLGAAGDFGTGGQKLEELDDHRVEDVLVDLAHAGDGAGEALHVGFAEVAQEGSAELGADGGQDHRRLLDGTRHALGADGGARRGRAAARGDEGGVGHGA